MEREEDGEVYIMVYLVLQEPGLGGRLIGRKQHCGKFHNWLLLNSIESSKKL